MSAADAGNAANPLQNAKHEALLQAYLADPERVGYRCYIGVYPNSSEAAAKTAFSRLLKNADFKARLDFLSAGVARVVSEKLAITVENVVAELAKIGFANMGDYMKAGPDGAPRLSFANLTRDQQAALQEVTCEEEIEGVDVDDDIEPTAAQAKPTIVRKTKFKLHDKKGALIAIGEHLGAFVKKHADPDGRALGTGAAEVVAEAFTDLEAARRVAFLLESVARGKPAPPKQAKPKGG